MSNNCFINSENQINKNIINFNYEKKKYLGIYKLKDQNNNEYKNLKNDIKNKTIKNFEIIKKHDNFKYTKFDNILFTEKEIYMNLIKTNLEDDNKYNTLLINHSNFNYLKNIRNSLLIYFFKDFFKNNLSQENKFKIDISLVKFDILDEISKLNITNILRQNIKNNSNEFKDLIKKIDEELKNKINENRILIYNIEFINKNNNKKNIFIFENQLIKFENNLLKFNSFIYNWITKNQTIIKNINLMIKKFSENEISFNLLTIFNNSSQYYKINNNLIELSKQLKGFKLIKISEKSIIKKIISKKIIKTKNNSEFDLKLKLKKQKILNYKLINDKLSKENEILTNNNNGLNNKNKELKEEINRYKILLETKDKNYLKYFKKYENLKLKNKMNLNNIINLENKLNELNKNVFNKYSLIEKTNKIQNESFNNYKLKNKLLKEQLLNYSSKFKQVNFKNLKNYKYIKSMIKEINNKDLIIKSLKNKLNLLIDTFRKIKFENINIENNINSILNKNEVF